MPQQDFFFTKKYWEAGLIYSQRTKLQSDVVLPNPELLASHLFTKLATSTTRVESMFYAHKFTPF
jgi:hypothetical protein